MSRQRSWTRYDIRVATYCKYKIWHAGAYIKDTDRFKFNNINIHLTAAVQIDAFLVVPVGDKDLSHASIYRLAKGNRITIKKIASGQVWWIMYKAENLKAGTVGLSVWASEEDVPKADKDAVLKAEADTLEEARKKKEAAE